MANEMLKPQIGAAQIQQVPKVGLPPPTYDVMVTTLPNGRQESWLKVSILLSPRLKLAADGTLVLFKPLFTADWPNFVKSLKFDVFFDAPSGPVQLPTQGEWELAPPPANVPPFDAALWASLFRETLLVRGYKFDSKDYTSEQKFAINTFPEKALVTSVKQELYQPVALESVVQLPSKGMILNRLQQMKMVMPDVRLPSGFRVGVENPVLELNRIRQDVLKKMTPGALQQGPAGQIPGLPGMGPVFQRGVGDFAGKRSAAPKMADPQAQKDVNLLQYQAFHQVYRRPREQPVPPRPAPPQFDFHQIVASLSEYPELAKRLALRVDLRVKVDPRIPANSAVWVRPAIADAAMANRFISPKTGCVLSGVTGFMSKPLSPEMQDGMLKFGLGFGGVPLYDVVPGDVDGMVRRVEAYSTRLVETFKPAVGTRGTLPFTKSAPGATLQQMQAPVMPTQQVLAEPTSLPPMRSGGLSVARKDRDQWLDDLLDRSKANGAKLEQAAGIPRGTSVVLTADDLVRGFRIDVREVRRGPGGTPSFTPWRSLCFRRGAHVLLGPVPPPPGASLPPPVLVYDDEGWVSLGATQGDEPPASHPMRMMILAQPKPLQIYQSLFRWDGWSLVVTRPGRHLGIDDQPSQGPGGVLAGISMQVFLTPVPSTLPRLRFGRQYQFRARVVDLAGNSLGVNDAPAPAPDFVTDVNDGYNDRMEPVPSPVIGLTAPLTGPPPAPPILGPDGKPLYTEGLPLSPGESMERLVIRTHNVERPGDPIEGLPALPPPGPSGRHMIPPKISQELAEQHGLFDDPGSRMMRGADAFNVITTKDGSLSDLIPPADPRRKLILKPGDEFYPEPSLIVPYLPDPMATGVTCLVYPPGGDAAAVPAVQVPFPVQGGWPNVGSFRIQLEPGEGPPDPSQPNVLKILVPQGEERIVRISSYLLSEKDPQFGQPNRETLFGIWRWIEERATPADRDRLRRAVQSGRHWMLTPFHQLVMVHATQQPVLTPQWVCVEELPKESYGQQNALECTVQTPAANLARHRRPGETVATIDATIAIHRPSTGSLDLLAKWREPMDDPDKKMTSENLEEWLYVEGSAAPFDVKVSYVPSPQPVVVAARGVPGEAEAAPPILLPDAQELPVQPEVQTREVPGDASPGDVEERGLPLGPTMRKRMPILPGVAQAQPSPQAGALQKVPPAAAAQIPPVMVAPAPPPGPPPYDESKDRCAPLPPSPPPPNYGQRFRFQGLHRFGDTRYRCVRYSAVATTRYREYFRPLPDEEIVLLKQGSVPPRWSRTSPEIKLDILSSAQPDAPQPLYIVPTWRWEQMPQGRRRIGGGLRVYLERPWFSTGEGEKLAVVLYPQPHADFDHPSMEQIKHYVTQWGLDPLWLGKDPSIGMAPGVLKDQPFLQQAPKMLDPRLQVPAAPGPGPGTGPTELAPRVMPRGAESLQGLTQQQMLALAQVQVQPGLAKQMDPFLLQLLGVGRSQPAPHHFRNAVTVRHDLGLQEVRVPLQVGTRGPEQFGFAQLKIQPGILAAALTRPMPITICAFEVKPDPSRQLWYCDIEVDPGTAYFPFIRLALARYQPNSVPGMHLSRVVLADFAQLVPDRTVSVVPDPAKPGELSVTVAGVQGSTGVSRTSVIEVSPEEFDPNLPGELGWVPVPNARPVQLPRVSAQQWTGSVALPPPGGKQHRLVVREYEVFAVRGEADTSRAVERRLVYADVVPVRG